VSIELVATEYAEGLLHLAIKKQALEEWMEELNQVKTVFEENPRFRMFYESPVVGRDETKKAVIQVFRGKVSDEVLRLLLLLVDKERTVIFSEFCRLFEKLVHRERKEIEVKVETPAPISHQDEKKVKTFISSSLGQQVYLTKRVRPEMIGGIVLEFLGQRWDGSVKGHMERLTHELRERCPATAFSIEGG
jgi:F-type H+-transporting ATPase subunit delta